MAETDGEHREGGAVTVAERTETEVVAEAPVADAKPEHHDPYSVENMDALRASIANVSPEARHDLDSASETYGWKILAEVDIDGNELGPDYVRNARAQINEAADELHSILSGGGIEMDNEISAAYVARAREVKQAEILDQVLPVVDTEGGTDAGQAERAAVRTAQRERLSHMLSLNDDNFDKDMKDWDTWKRIDTVRRYDLTRAEAEEENNRFDKAVQEEIDRLDANYSGMLERVGSGPVRWAQLEGVLNGTAPESVSAEDWYARESASGQHDALKQRLGKLLGTDDIEALAGQMLNNRYFSEVVMPLVAQANGHAPEGSELNQLRADVIRLATDRQARDDMAQREQLLKRPERVEVPEVPAAAPVVAEKKLGRLARWRASRAARKAGNGDGAAAGGDATPNQGQ